MSKQKQQRRRNRLWAADPRCHWCGVETVLPVGPGDHRPTIATIDHLRPRHDPERHAPNPGNIPRTVLACWQCNTERDARDYNALPAEERHRRSHPPRAVA